MHKSPKMVEDKRMLVGVFMTSFSFCLWGCEGEGGEGNGYIQLCISDVQETFLFPCKPVSLSNPTFFFGQSDPTILTPNAPLLLHKTPKTGSNYTFTKAAKGSNKIHRGEVCSKQSLILPSLFFFFLVMNTIHFSKRLLAICTLPTTNTPDVFRE